MGPDDRAVDPLHAVRNGLACVAGFEDRLAEDHRAFFVAGVDELEEEIGAAAGITLAVEPLNRFESDVLCTTQQAMELLDAVDHPAVAMMLDTFHMHMEESSIPEAIRLAGGRIAHFQANENHRGFPGTGATDWVAVFRALHEVGYAGPVSLEPFRRNDDRFGVPFAQWRAPHEDEDARLKASAAFIRSHISLTEYRR
jgi:D-psicose/D-tagatose/L-ribulose 3-epimerase